MPRRLSSPVFEDPFVLKTHHATSRLRQTPVGVPHTRPPSSIERRRRTVLRSSPSLRTKRWSTPKAASHHLSLPRKRYPYPNLIFFAYNQLCQAFFVLAPPYSCFLPPDIIEESHVGLSAKAISTEPPSSRSHQFPPQFVPARCLLLNPLDPTSPKLPQTLGFYTRKRDGELSTRPRWALRPSVESDSPRPRHHIRATHLCCHPANQ